MKKSKLGAMILASGLAITGLTNCANVQNIRKSTESNVRDVCTMLECPQEAVKVQKAIDCYDTTENEFEKAGDTSRITRKVLKTGNAVKCVKGLNKTEKPKLKGVEK